MLLKYTKKRIDELRPLLVNAGNIWPRPARQQPRYLDHIEFQNSKIVAVKHMKLEFLRN